METLPISLTKMTQKKTSGVLSRRHLTTTLALKVIMLVSVQNTST